MAKKEDNKKGGKLSDEEIASRKAAAAVNKAKKDADKATANAAADATAGKLYASNARPVQPLHDREILATP